MELTTTMKKKKTRLIVRKGNENVVLKVEDIAFIYRDLICIECFAEKPGIVARISSRTVYRNFQCGKGIQFDFIESIQQMTLILPVYVLVLVIEILSIR